MSELHIIFDATLLVLKNFWPALVIAVPILRALKLFRFDH